MGDYEKDTDYYDNELECDLCGGEFEYGDEPVWLNAKGEETFEMSSPFHKENCTIEFIWKECGSQKRALMLSNVTNTGAAPKNWVRMSWKNLPLGLRQNLEKFYFKNKA